MGTTHRGIGPGLRGPRPAGRPAGRGPARRGLASGPGSARVLPDKNALLARLPGDAQFELEPLVAEAMAWGERLRPHLADTIWLVQDALARGEHVLLEGAQGTLLDLDHGTYPYVTSLDPDRRRGLHRAAGSARSRSTRSSGS